MIQVDFNVSQSLDGKTIRITDKTPYADPDGLSNIQSRVLQILRQDGTSLPGFANPIPFPVVSGTDDYIDISISQDYALGITLTVAPVVPQSGSIYEKEHDVVLVNLSKAKLYDREAWVSLNVVECETSYNTVNYTILRYIDSAIERTLRGDLTGSQKLLDKISNIGLKDCDC